MKASQYSPGGRSHSVLALLDTGPATLEEIRDHSGASGRARRMYFFIVRALLAEGLIRREDGLYAITDAGSDVLHELRRGVRVGDGAGLPNVRVFQTGAAA